MRRPLLTLLLLSLPAGCETPQGSRGEPASPGVHIPPPPSATITGPDEQASIRPLPGSVAIHPMHGLADLPVGKATRRDFIAKLGEPAHVEEHGTYSVSLRFAGGVEATYCRSDETQTVRWVSFEAPFAGHVEGAAGKPPIVLGKTRIRDVITLRGKGEWTTSDGSDTWACGYPSGEEREVRFFVKRDTSVPHFPLDEARHLDRRVVQIEVALVFAGCTDRGDPDTP